jgi:hypothetical protein
MISNARNFEKIEYFFYRIVTLFLLRLQKKFSHSENRFRIVLT